LTETVPDILARIVARKRQELAEKRSAPRDLELSAVEQRGKRRAFSGKLRREAPSVIAEIKKASPSKGVLRPDFDPARIAVDYEQGGASALSVLTDRTFFQGSLDDLKKARGAVGLPVLRKDFTLVEEDVLEAAAHGADAILLITAILDDRELRDLREAAAQWNMDALVEVHDETELARAVASGAEIIGVNNRNLVDFQVTLETSLRLAGRMPDSVLRVSESGIHSAADIARLEQAGYHAFLVGEHLMKASQPAAALRDLVKPA
jgi:indole-3-glycerol phosphate synthase